MTNLNQYLTSVLKASNDVNELRLLAGTRAFDWFSVYLENHNAGIHRYRANTATLFYQVQGTANIKVNGKILTLGAGNLLLFNPRQEYEVVKQPAATILAKIKFKPSFNYQSFLENLVYQSAREDEIIAKLLTKLNQDGLLLFKNTQVSQPSQLMQKLLNDYLNDEVFVRSLIVAEVTTVVILSLQEQSLLSSIALSHNKFAGTALDHYLDVHFRDVTLTQAANYFALNPNYFSNLVKQKTGKSFVEHVDERRMQEARNLLAQPNISLKEIISRVGYSSKSFFYKKFNEYYHQTPAEMRRELFRQANINLK
ncbi:helix-turn-helix transcriptional regulator [Lactobacillus sp. ESL0791]|uniref:helix-turn-helix domain-containing protein n=1 Tax=Lactobacillus sp. ESL0791 TaxID=2983234 RepID=UPI0023F8136D|nr:helix-turn-helix transcriptional regulator [Lactobacillus sp. ESL0791]MDF7637945.1 helix-turn-helix transcriptional regulator [Lactobacillus sp. ESL0791]